MGIFCSSCCKSNSHQELISPDIETRRRQQAAAAEQRVKLNQGRGLSNPERVQRKIEEAHAREDRLEKMAKGSDGPVLKWQAN